MSSRVCAAAFLFIVSRAFAIEPLEEIVEQQYDVDANATISVENLDGSIRVYASAKPIVKIQAIKRAYTRERLQGIVIDTKATRNSVALTTIFPPRKNALSDRSGTVDYNIVVPHTARITDLKLTNGEMVIEGLRDGGSARAHLVNGWLCGHNCFGNLEFTLEAGRIDLAFDWWENAKFSVKANSTRGHVRAVLPYYTSVNLNATAAGRIANEFDENKTDSGDIVHSISTVIGPKAEATISLEASRGNVRIEKIY
jgi:hypothetical protein